MRPDKFLTAEQQDIVVAAVRLAEKGTSGEIRVHIDGDCKGDLMERAEEVFSKLGMHRTKLRNGVLIYLACNTKVFAIIGDQGINEVVPDGFWDDTAQMMSEYFRLGCFTEGLSRAVAMVGENLKTFFPYQEGDVNELPDDISFGKNEE